MKAEEITERVRQELNRELRKAKRRITIQEVEAALGHFVGYLHAFRTGASSLGVDKLAKTLEIIGVDPGRFFGNAFPAPRTNDYLLAELRTGGQEHKRVQELERAAVASERWLGDPSGQPTASGRRLTVAKLYAKMIATRPHEQCRRLRQGKIYRRAGFAHRYLEYLDSLRYDDPQNVVHLARGVAVYLLPRTPCEPRDRLALEIRTLGIYASAHRNTGGYTTARRALCFALDMARRHDMPALIAELLQRGAYLLSDHGRFGDAIRLLDEAMVIYVKLGAENDLGRVLVDHGYMLNKLGKYSECVSCLQRSLAFFEGHSPQISRNRLAAHELLGLAFLNMGDLERAESALQRATQEVPEPASLHLAKLLWDGGTIALAREAYSYAEEQFRRAAELFYRAGSPNRALVCLDLTDTLYAQGKTEEATQLAVSMAELLTAFRGNELLEAAISGLMRSALENNLSRDRIQRAKKEVIKSLPGTTRSGVAHRATPDHV